MQDGSTVTFRNELATSADISITSLRTALIDFRNFRDGRNKRLNLRPMKIIVPPDGEWDVREILKSALDVARIILDPKLPVSPTVVRFSPRQKTVVGLVTHANSITLTPGTLSIEVGYDQFTVHALTREGAAATAVSEMDRRVERFEGSA